MSRMEPSNPISKEQLPSRMGGLSILQLMALLGSLGIIAWLVLNYLKG